MPRWCYDEFSCNYRFKNAQYSMSSSTWKDSFVQGGIFEDSPAKSPLAGATKAFVPYCTSDAWVGDAEAYGYQFRGQRIVASTLAAFVQKQGLGSEPGHRLVFGGCSAGGRGASFNLDYVPQILSDAGAAFPVTVVGLFDAAMWVDIPPALPGIVSQQCQTAALLDMVNATHRLGDACVAAYPEPTERGRCAVQHAHTSNSLHSNASSPESSSSTLPVSVRPVPAAVRPAALHAAGQPA